MNNARKIVQEVMEGFRITSSTQEVEITGWAQADLISMQKTMLKANPCFVFDVIELGKESFLLIYVEKKAKFVSNVIKVDFKNKSIISHGHG